MYKCTSTLKNMGLILFFVLIISPLYSQYEKGYWKVGPTIGFNTSNIVFSGTGEAQLFRWEPISTLAIGVSGNYYMSDAISLKSGVSITKRGTTFRPLIDVELSSTYLEIPVLLQYEYDASHWLENLAEGHFKAYGFFGPYFGLGLSSSSSQSNSGFGTEDLTKFDVGVMLGTGININISGHEGSVEYSYSISIKDVDNRPDLTSLFTNGRLSFIYYLKRSNPM